MPGEGRGSPAARVKVDPYNTNTFMRFVAVAAVDLLGAHKNCATRKDTAAKAFIPPVHPAQLSAELGKKAGPSPEFLGRLERLYLYQRHPLHNGAPWLTSFHEDLHRVSGRIQGKAGTRAPDVGGGTRHQPVLIPTGWFYNLANHRPRNSTEAFIQGHALRAFLSEARQVADAAKSDDGERTAEQIVVELLAGFDLTQKARKTVNHLLEVVAGPPHTGLPAVRLVASIGELALGQVEEFIFHHPAGFRGIRILGRILVGPRSVALRGQVEPLLKKIYNEEPRDPYPARSLLVEALRFAPRGGEEWPWVIDALLERAQDPDRPTRERVYAAYALFDREKHGEARSVMEKFKASNDEGLTYAADFLKVWFLRKEGRRTPYAWPYERTEHAIVDGATEFLEDDETVPASVRGALRMMVRGALLTIDGTARRSICEAIQAAGLSVSAVDGLSSVMSEETSPPWLVEHAAFIVGYLQTGDRIGAGKAVAALVPLAEDQERPTAVRHAALWGIGDIAGSVESLTLLEKGWLDAAANGQASEKAERRLARLVDQCSATADNAPEVRRAAAYTATMLARRSPILNKKQQKTAVSRILERIVQDDDQLVRELGLWGQRIETARIHDSYLGTMELGSGP